jgi:hypothetical protein
MTFAEYLLDHIFLPRLQERRVLVVFDPQKRYLEICQHLQSEQCQVVFTEGRPISSRQEAMERWMAMGADTTFQSQMLLYCVEASPVPGSEAHLAHPFAAYMAIGHQFPSLRAGDDFKQLCHRFLRGRTAEVEQLFAGAEPTFAMIDSLVEGSNAVPRLKALFGSPDATQIIRRFLVPNETQQKALEEGSEWGAEFQQLCQRTLGLAWEAKVTRIETIQKKLWQYLLFSEFASDLPEKLPSGLAALPRAQGAHLLLVKDLCDGMRKDQEQKEVYREEAKRVQEQLDLEKECEGVVDLGRLDTFAFEERRFLYRAVVAFRAEELSAASDILREHQRGVWTEEGERALLWRILELGLETLGAIRRAEDELRALSVGGAAICQAYEDTLIAVDCFYRRLEEAAAQTVESYEEIDDVVVKVRGQYRTYFNQLQAQFLKSVTLEGWPLKAVPFNTNTYDELVAPPLREGKRVVYFLIDAFRLDLAQDIETALSGAYRITLKSACAQLPCVTRFGMASLLPNAGSKLRIERQDGELEPQYDGKFVGTRADRMAVFKSVLNDRVTELNLAAFIENTRTKKGLESLLSSTTKADLLVLTSTELDGLGESTSTIHLNQIPLIVQQIQLAIRRCQELDFDLAVIATDHGFLWVEDTDTGSVCEKPPGDWPLAKRRCLIGQGDGESGVLKLVPTQIGIPTTEAAYVTPRALATFSKGTGYFHEGLSLQESLVPRLVVEFDKKKPAATAAVPEIALTVRKTKILARTVAVTVSWPSEALLGFAEPAYAFKLVALQNKAEIGHPTSSEHLDAASGLVKIARGNSFKVSVLLNEQVVEGAFQLKAIAPETEKVIESLDLNYEPAI